MNNVKKLQRDCFGLEDKSLFEREFNYYSNGEIPVNAIIVDKIGNCYMSGAYIGNGLTFGGKCRVWFNNGTNKIMNLKAIKALTEDKLTKIPKENFVFKVENGDYNPKRESYSENPYDKKSTGICLKFIYDRTLLVEHVFVPDCFYKYLGNSDGIKSKIEIYNKIYKAYNSVETNFDRNLLALMLQKLEKSNKYYATISRSISDDEYEYIKELYEEKNIDWISKSKQIYGLFKMVSIYGLDELQTIKDEYGTNQDISKTVSNLKKLKKYISFPGVCSEPDAITATHTHCFYSDDEISYIQESLNKITINNDEDFLNAINLFDSKMIRRENFTKFMAQVLDKSTYLDENKKAMMKDLLELQDFIELMHTIYGNHYFNTCVLNGKTGNVKTRIHWLLSNDKKELKDIKYFKINDYEDKKEYYENSLLEKIISKFKESKERRDKGKAPNLDIYQALVARFEEELIEIKDGIVIFNVNDNLLNKIFDYVKTDNKLLLDILKHETFGHVDRKEYFAKLKSENALYKIIEDYNK